MLRRQCVFCLAMCLAAGAALHWVPFRTFADDAKDGGDSASVEEIEIGGKALVEVVDEERNPVEGCTLIGVGLRSHQDPGTGYGWMPRMHGPRPVAVTDVVGRAEVSWPRWIQRQNDVTTAKVSVMAEHPDFCLIGQEDLDVAAGVRTKITLKRGGRLRLHAFRPGDKKPLTDFRAQISGHYDGLRDWQDVVGGPAGRISPAMEAGPRLIRLVQPEEDGTLLFSDLLRFESKVGVVEDRLLKLKPAMTIRGQLSDNVPRPVKDGYVVAVVADQISKAEFQAESLDWQTWRPVNADGSFEVNKLPPASKVRLLVLCDGYVSSQPEKDSLPEHLQRFANVFSMPQFFDLPEDDSNLTVKMEQAAACRIKVVGPDGQPLEGVDAGLFPNVVYSSGSTIFGTSDRSEDAMLEPRLSILDMVRKWERLWPQEERDESSSIRMPSFYSKTDSEGVVVIRNLPPRSPQGLFAQHEDYVPAGTKPPYRLQQQVELSPGQTSEATIKMIPKPDVKPE